jgi:hypothetical protein
MTMIKKTLLVVLCAMLMAYASFGQRATSAQVLDKLSTISDQYGDRFDPNIKGEIKLIFIEGSNAMMAEIYSKFKGKRLVNKVTIVGGMANLMPGVDTKVKYDHLSDGFQSDRGLGMEGYSILFDMSSATLTMLELNKYTIVTISKQENKMNIEDFGSNRIEFLKAVKIYFN